MSYSSPYLRDSPGFALSAEPALAPSLEAAADVDTRVEQATLLVSWFADIDVQDVATVGGKAASLGEMFGALADKGVRIPNGFATTVAAYDRFLDAPGAIDNWGELSEQAERIGADVMRAETLREAVLALFAEVDPSDHLDLHGGAALARALVRATPIPPEVDQALRAAYRVRSAE